MAKLTWIGEDELHGGGAGPSFTHALGGIKFPKGEAVEVRSYAIVQKAIGNQFFEVEDEDDVDDAPKPEKNKGGRPRKSELGPEDMPPAKPAFNPEQQQASQLSQQAKGE